ncbi:coiled-coil domain-containing protein AGAP005037-like isoform X19 [Amphibalanus amphitrite]|nr:coiled-coil domain-containing protein AGAP005037-like isoform X19 [Amphibalanus amphitrite]XP_043200475.1 coiled-coil domain-containing protein AGAP005037-like isoform X19 [Amphibalanus amphitrite]
MDLDSNKSSSDSERSVQSQQANFPPAKPERRSFPLFSGGRGNNARQQPPVKGYMGSPSSSMFDDDPGIMSEAETASTGFRRGVKVRSSLPVVRTTSKTMERPLGVVFLQYRNETKRALLPNEITSLDTVKALFVRSFQHQLTMEYLDSPACKIYILDSSRDVFYDMEDIRPLSGRDIRDRSVLRIFETDQPQSAPTNGTTWDDNSYFSEPEFDGDQQNQHVHKTKGKGDAFRMPGGPYPAGARPAGTYPPRGQSDMPPASRGYHPGPGPPPKPQRAGCAGGRSGRAAAAPRPVFYPGDGYAGSPERGRGYPYPGGAAGFGDQYYPPPYRNPLVDEEARLAGFYDPAPARRAAGGRQFDDKVRVESMERQLANLTGLVQKALHTPRVNRAVSDLDSGYRSDRETYHRTPSANSSFEVETEYRPPPPAIPDDHLLKPEKPPKLGRGKDKSVSFEKSVSFSDDHHDPPKQHSPTHAADKVPVKPAIKSSTLPRMGSQERIKPPPPPKPAILTTYESRHAVACRDLHLSPETYNQLRSLQKKAHDLRLEMRKLRRLSQDHATAVNEMIGDTYSKIRVCLLSSAELAFGGGETESVRVRKQEDAYSKDVLGVEKDLGEVEQHVEDLRSNVINRRRRVNMSDVESMALVLSRSSKTVAELQKRLPELQTELRGLVAQEAERVKKEERFIGEEPLRLENALRRIKKLSGTLVTLKRLASVQEQRVPDTEDAAAGAAKPADAQSKLPAGASAAGHQSAADEPHTLRAAGAAGAAGNSLDALLSELQDGGGNGGGAAAGTGAEPAPPPPPPPPRTSSRSPARSEWTRPPAPLSRAVSAPGAAPLSSTLALSDESLGRDAASSSSSSSESVSSQRPTGAAEALQRREAELRRKQAALQQQYARLQAMHGAPPRPAGEAQPAAPPLEDSDRPAAAQQQP